MSLPGVIDCDSFDDGEGVGYHAIHPGSPPATYDPVFDYRPGCGIAILGPLWLDTYRYTGVVYGAQGEWVSYVINVPKGGGNYTCNFIVHNFADARAPGFHFGGGIFHLEADGSDVTGPIFVPNFDTNLPKTLTSNRTMSLTAGKHILRLVFDKNGGGWWPYVAKFDRMEIGRISK